MRRKEHRTGVNKMGPWELYRLSVCEVVDIGNVGVNNNNNNNNNIFIYLFLLTLSYDSRKSNVTDNFGILKENTER